jgi:hypothetical protein
VTTLEGATQVIAQGPVASQEVIKEMGTNGGGFFNANSAHPYENPSPLTNFVEMVLIFSIGAALTNVFGRMVGKESQGWAIFAVMGILFLAGVSIIYGVESQGNPAFTELPVDAKAGALQAGGNMEGKEVRFGIVNSSLFATVTTDASCGAVNAMHDSLLPLGGMVPLVNMMLGEIIYGGVGSGLYGMLLFAIIAIFVAGLMVGRTPEYLGKKIEAKKVKMAMLAILILPFSILGFTALAVVLPTGLSSLANAGPHGYSEALYAYTSGTANNGSAFAGISANTPFYNTTLGLAMWIGHFLFIVPMLAIAGSLAGKKLVPASEGTFPTDGALFVGLLIGVILIIGGLTFFPALALGPIVEHLAMNAGTCFDRGKELRDKTNEREIQPAAFCTDTARPGDPRARNHRRLSQARPEAHDPQPGHVHRGDRDRAHDDPLLAGPVARSAGERAAIRLPDLALAVDHLAVANFAEAVAEGRGKAQAASLRKTRTTTFAKRLASAQDTRFDRIQATNLKVNDFVLVEAGDMIPSDGEVIEGIASVDESAITGESAPVIRESGGDRSAVTGGTRVLSDWIKVRITAAQGSTFLDRMISLVEGAERQKTPNEIALNILLAGLTLIFVFAVAVGAEALIVAARDGFAMFVLPGMRRLDSRRTRGLIGKYRFARPDEVSDATGGLEIGTIPPFGSFCRNQSSLSSTPRRVPRRRWRPCGPTCPCNAARCTSS